MGKMPMPHHAHATHNMPLGEMSRWPKEGIIIPVLDFTKSPEERVNTTALSLSGNPGKPLKDRSARASIRFCVEIPIDRGDHMEHTEGFLRLVEESRSLVRESSVAAA